MNEDISAHKWDAINIENQNDKDVANQEDKNFIADYENFEDHIDQDLNRQNVEKFKSSILFCVQELGAKKLYHNNDIFIKGKNCEDSLKDLNKFVKNDSVDDPTTKL